MATQLQFILGSRYETRAIEFIGWVDGNGNPVDADSIGAYSFHDYFDSDGSYLGPDAEGIEPIGVEVAMGGWCFDSSDETDYRPALLG